MKIDLTPVHLRENRLKRRTALRPVGAENFSYPSYDIEIIDKDRYALIICAAGFCRDEFDIEVRNRLLIVRAVKKTDTIERKFLHKGIRVDDFDCRFNLAEYIEISGAKYENGLLTIGLKRELPEHLKSRRIIVSQEPDERIIEHQANDE